MGFKKKAFLILLIFVILCLGLWYTAKKDLLPFSFGPFSKGAYQAVFLSNGQVYFGRIKNINDQYATLTGVFYLIVKQPLQEGAGAGAEGTVTPGTQKAPEYTLIKLGQELHGPIDKMIINRDHILFIEELKTDGKIASAIADYKGGRTVTPSPTPTPKK